ncbi:MAG TPA: hypothetical protein GXZ26_06605 [Firmicutes bacterium]|jgi:hypothetical protein|nr:hypothetical protein [Bacillota bacterium]
MGGDTFFFFCIAILLFWILWERIRNRLRLTGLNSRIRQLEELLLEVCAVLEESLKKEEPETSFAAQLEPAMKESGEPEKPEELEEPEKLEAPEELEESEKPVSPLPLVGKKDYWDPQAKTVAMAEEQPTAEQEGERGTGEGKPAIHGQTGGEESGQPELQAADRRRQVLELFHQGIPVKTIARKIGMGQGEAQLIIDLYARRGE